MSAGKLPRFVTIPAFAVIAEQENARDSDMKPVENYEAEMVRRFGVRKIERDHRFAQDDKTKGQASRLSHLRTERENSSREDA